MTTVSETLTAAADHLEAHDLHKGSLTDGEGNVCALGAIRAAVTGPNLLDFMENSDECERFDGAANALGEVLDLPRAGIPKWNDAPERTKEDVVRALRDTADLESLDETVPVAESALVPSS